jgi:hypothetical protein
LSFWRSKFPGYDHIPHDVPNGSGYDTVKPSPQVVGSCPLALDHHRRKVPYIICAISLRHSYDPINVSHGHAVASWCLSRSCTCKTITDRCSCGYQGSEKRRDGFLNIRFWYLAAFGTSYRGNTPGCTPSATACQQWACCSVGPRIGANDTYCITVNQNVDTHRMAPSPVYYLTRCDPYINLK